MPNFKINNFSKKGFTIVELLIAMGVFMFLMVATFGIYTVAIQRHYDAQKSQVVNQDLRYAMELMSRDIKNSLIRSSSFEASEYFIYLQSKKIKNSEGKDPNRFYISCEGIRSNCLIYKIDSSTNPDGTPGTCNGIWAKGPYDEGGDSSCDNYLRLTSQNVQILLGSKFDTGSLSGDSQENPRVTIFIHAKEKNDKKYISEIYLQTTATQKEVKKNIFEF